MSKVPPEGQQPMAKLFENFLVQERNRALHATGLTEKDFKYIRAEKVRMSEISGWVFVTIHGTEYGPAILSNGSLEPEGDNLTALVNAKQDPDAKQDNWTKAWFPQREIKPAPGTPENALGGDGFHDAIVAILSKDSRAK